MKQPDLFSDALDDVDAEPIIETPIDDAHDVDDFVEPVVEETLSADDAMPASPPIADASQGALFDRKDFSVWGDEWQGMPEFNNTDREPVASVHVLFASDAARVRFAELLGVPASAIVRGAMWYPPERYIASRLRYRGDEDV